MLMDTEALVVERADDEEGEGVIHIFRYDFVSDEVTSSFYLTEEELRVLAQQMNGATHE
jgi:hypothetical protein